jgi:phage terminase small subunit
MAKFMAELGLTPSSRSRLAVQLPNGPKPWETHDDW